MKFVQVNVVVGYCCAVMDDVLSITRPHVRKLEDACVNIDKENFLFFRLLVLIFSDVCFLHPFLVFAQKTPPTPKALAADNVL